MTSRTHAMTWRLRGSSLHTMMTGLQTALMTAVLMMKMMTYMHTSRKPRSEKLAKARLNGSLAQAHQRKALHLKRPSRIALHRSGIGSSSTKTAADEKLGPRGSLGPLLCLVSTRLPRKNQEPCIDARNHLCTLRLFCLAFARRLLCPSRLGMKNLRLQKALAVTFTGSFWLSFPLVLRLHYNKRPRVC